MTEVNPEDYYKVATKLVDASKTLETELKALDGRLDVSQSAGRYATGGPTWAQSYDQSAVDVFELGSLSSIAARELGYLVHQAGLNHAAAENDSSPGSPGQATPPRPEGSSLQINLHPAEHAVGGNGERPTYWELVADHVTREWADCDEGRIAAAGTNFQNFGTARQSSATTLWSDVTGVFSQTAQDQSPEVEGIVDDVASVCRSVSDTGDMATYLATACGEVNRVAAIDKSTGRTSLKILKFIIGSYEIDKLATYRLPFGERIRQQLDQLIESNKVSYAKAMDALIDGINGTVDKAAKSNTGIYSLATSSAQGLASILDRTPRQTNPLRNRDEEDNKAAGDEGERRAGIPLEGKQKVTVVRDGKQYDVIPDYIDWDNKNLTEVKNSNDVRKSTDQILAEAEYARQQGLTMTLVVDHRTQINVPAIQALIDSGQIQLVREELDDNNDL